MPIETHFDIPFISSLALHENHIQQDCQPMYPEQRRVHYA